MNTTQNRNVSTRVIYALLVLSVIALGILSRKIHVIPLIVGDILYAVMMFLLVKFLRIRLGYKKVALISWSVCCLIELSQLYSAPWINRIRSTRLGSLVLGSGFLWSDIVAYTIGTVIGLLFLYLYPLILKHAPNNS